MNNSAYDRNPTLTECDDVAFMICCVYPILACRGLTIEKCQDEEIKTLLERYFGQHPNQGRYNKLMSNYASGNMSLGPEDLHFMALIEEYNLLSRKMLAKIFPSIVPDPPGKIDLDLPPKSVERAPKVTKTAISIVHERSNDPALPKMPELPPFEEVLSQRDSLKSKKTTIDIINGTYDPVGDRKRAGTFYHHFEKYDKHGNKKLCRRVKFQM